MHSVLKSTVLRSSVSDLKHRPTTLTGFQTSVLPSKLTNYRLLKIRISAWLSASHIVLDDHYNKTNNDNNDNNKNDFNNDNNNNTLKIMSFHILHNTTTCFRTVLDLHPTIDLTNNQWTHCIPMKFAGTGI